MSSRILDLDPTSSILKIFEGQYRFAYIALHPFHKKVFSDAYDYESKLELTYPLLEPVSWEAVANEIGFKRRAILAAALTNTNKSHYRELSDFLDYKNLDFPDEWIPYEILVPALKVLVKLNVNQVSAKSLQTPFKHEQSIVTYAIETADVYDVAKQLPGKDFIEGAQAGIALFLPKLGLDECPYTIIFAQDRNHLEFVGQLPGGGFWADEDTKVQWW
jgi:hypothetical protein